MWTWISIASLLALVLLQGYSYQRRQKLISQAVAKLMGALGNIVAIAEEQNKVNHAQQDTNRQIGNNLELLGIHTKLIKPSVSFEAEQFLAWYNEQKRDDK